MLRKFAASLGRRFAAVARGRYPAEPVALMRIAGAAVALADLAATWRMAPLIWGPEQSPFLLAAAYGAWAAALVLLLVGYRTTLAAVASYLLAFPLIYHLPHAFEYHLDYYPRAWLFFLPFLASGRAYSVDSLLARRRAAAAGKPPPERTVALLVVVLFVAQLSLDYFDAGWQKATDPEMWGRGLGLYWPMVVRYASTGAGGWMLGQRWLLVGLSHLTVAWELAFPLLVLFRRGRRVAICLGVLVHFGIVVLLPVHYLGELMLAFYLVFLPRRWILGAGRGLRRLLPLGLRRLLPPPPASPAEGSEAAAGEAAAAREALQATDGGGEGVPEEGPSGDRRRRRLGARLRPVVLAAGLGWLLLAKLSHLGVVDPLVAPFVARTAATVHSFVRHPMFLSFHFRRTGVLEVELVTARGRERLPFVGADGYLDTLTQASTRVWVYMLRVGASPRPETVTGPLLRWLEATRPDVCRAVLSQRFVTPPAGFAGAVDVWTAAPRRHLLTARFPRPPERCPGPDGPDG